MGGSGEVGSVAVAHDHEYEALKGDLHSVVMASLRTIDLLLVE